MRTLKKAGSFLSILMMFGVVSATFPTQAFAEMYTGELRLPNTRIAHDFGLPNQDPISSSVLNGHDPFRTSVSSRAFSSSYRDRVTNCGPGAVSVNPQNNSIVLSYPADDVSGGRLLCSATGGGGATLQNTTLTPGGRYGLGLVTQTYDALPFATIGESAQTTSVESIPNDPNNVRVTVSDNVTEEVYGLRSVRQGDIWLTYDGDIMTRFGYNSPNNSLDFPGLYRDGRTLIIAWASNWVGQTPADGYPSGWTGQVTSCDSDGYCMNDPLRVNTGYPTPRIAQMAAIAPYVVNNSVIRPRNSDILYVSTPRCLGQSDNGFWGSSFSVHCDTTGFSADGRIGHAVYNNSVSTGGGFREFLGSALTFAGLVMGAQFAVGFLGTFSAQMTAIQSAVQIATEQGTQLVVANGATVNVIGDVLASQLTAEGVASSVAGRAAVSAIGTFTAGAVAAISGPTAYGTVESSNGLGVGTWTWSPLPAFASGAGPTTCTNGATDYPTCTPPRVCRNGASNYPVCTIIRTCASGATNYPTCLFTGSNDVVNAPTTSLSVSCSGAPGNPYVNQPVTWSSSVTGGSGSYIYEWTGTDDLWNTTPSFTKSYATAGVKQASLSVTDSVSHSTASASCATGADQQGGSATGGGGTGVGVSSCTSSFSASPTTVEQGQSINLAWNVSGGSLCASSCSGIGFSTGGAVSGSTTAVPSPASHSYALSCSAGTYGPPANENATVTVRVPIAVISASPLRVTTGNNTTVTWSSENSSSCVVTKNGISWRTDIGPISVPDPVTTQTVYKIDCVNNYGVHVTDSVIVNVVPIFNEF